MSSARQLEAIEVALRRRQKAISYHGTTTIEQRKSGDSSCLIVEFEHRSFHTRLSAMFFLDGHLDLWISSGSRRRLGKQLLAVQGVWPLADPAELVEAIVVSAKRCARLEAQDHQATLEQLQHRWKKLL